MRYAACVPRVIGISVLIGCLFVHSSLRAQGNYSLGLSLHSDEIPGFDAQPSIEGDVGREVVFTADLTISFPNFVDPVQGWSLSLWHAGLELVDFTEEGTESARQADGGLREDNERDGFFRFEMVDPEKNDGRHGVVQAVVLSFTNPTTLPPDVINTVGRNRYLARVEEQGRIAFLRYEDGLAGAGQPVGNVLTASGASVIPSFAARDIRIGSDILAEGGRCTDGVDNDNDGWTDCLDPDCFTSESCGREICDDGFDNDGDESIDCEDTDCLVACAEVCDDGEDNDEDGAIDCVDSDCRGVSPCDAFEACGDGVDNDEDGDVDCDDSDCRGNALCRVPEICDDGIDNDLDGDVDCDDRGCRGVGPCPAPEVCSDGVDNDLDGDVDCDDADCELRSSCLDPEDCTDGIDNDLDGRVDCDDSNCSSLAICDDTERCSDGIDNDGDGAVDCDDTECARRGICTGDIGAGGGGLAPGGDEPGFDLVLYSPGAYRERDGVPVDEAVDVERDVNVLLVAFDQEAEVDVITFIVPSDIEGEGGIQGWSISVEHDEEVMSLEIATIDGTDAGDLIDGGFEKSEGVENRGRRSEEAGPVDSRAGFVSAVVLSFTQPISLPVDRPSSIARATYRLEDNFGPAGEGSGTVRFVDGLQGSGQPVNNNLTALGSTLNSNHRVPLEVRRVASPPFLRGDANDDGRVDIGDAIWSLNFLYRNGPETACREAADVNADSKEDMSDAIYIIQYRFLSGPPIPSPFPDCGFETGKLCDPGSVSSCN